MKKLDLSAVTDAAQFYPKKGTFNFLQLAFQEGFSSIIETLIGSAYNPSIVYILSGVGVNIGGVIYYNPNFVGVTTNYMTGYAYYNGEFFIITASTITPTTGQVPLFILNSTSYTTNADPVTFTDHTTHNIHIIRSLSIVAGAVGGSGTTGYIYDFENSIRLVDINRLVDMFSAQTIAGVKTFSNSPIVPTPSIGDNSTKAASTAYVDRAFSPPHPVLAAGNVNVGDVAAGAGTSVTITFSAAITAAYVVNGAVIASSSNLTIDTGVSWSIFNKTTTGFSIHFQEYAGGTQTISFDYSVIAV